VARRRDRPVRARPATAWPGAARAACGGSLAERAESGALGRARRRRARPSAAGEAGNAERSRAGAAGSWSGLNLALRKPRGVGRRVASGVTRRPPHPTFGGAAHNDAAPRDLAPPLACRASGKRSRTIRARSGRSGKSRTNESRRSRLSEWTQLGVIQTMSQRSRLTSRVPAGGDRAKGHSPNPVLPLVESLRLAADELTFYNGQRYKSQLVRDAAVVTDRPGASLVAVDERRERAYSTAAAAARGSNFERKRGEPCVFIRPFHSQPSCARSR
jgi:hypothetical protein